MVADALGSSRSGAAEANTQSRPRCETGGSLVPDTVLARLHARGIILNSDPVEPSTGDYVGKCRNGVLIISQRPLRMLGIIAGNDLE